MHSTADGDDIHQSVDPDMTTFAMQFRQCYGLEQLFVISRTKKGVRHSQHGRKKIDHFSIRVCKAAGLMKLGMSSDQIHLCKHKSGVNGKGPIAAQLGLTHFVDNDWENLQAISQYGQGILKAVIFYDNSPAMSSLRRNTEIAASHDWGGIQCHVVESWVQIAALVDLPAMSPQEWIKLRNVTPPFCKYDPAILNDALQDGPGDDNNDDAAPSRTWKPSSSSASPSLPVAKPAVKAMPTSDAPPVLIQTAKGSPMMTSPVLKPSAKGPPPVIVLDPATAEAEEPDWVRSMAASAKSLAASAKQFAAPPPPPPPPPPPQQIDPDELKRAVSTAIAETLASDNIKRRILGTHWYTKKQQRAEMHAAAQTASSKSSSVPISKASGSAPHRFLPRPVMCATCNKSQPGAYCCRGMCRPCCLNSARTGGSDKVCQQPQHTLPMQ